MIDLLAITPLALDAPICETPGIFIPFDMNIALMEFTGLFDKNGKPIFEDDIVKFKRIFGFHSELLNEWKDLHGLSTINGIGSLFTGIVVMDFHRGLMLKCLNNDYAEPFFTRHFEIRANHDWDTCEVIGNIYENPELTK